MKTITQLSEISRIVQEDNRRWIEMWNGETWKKITVDRKSPLPKGVVIIGSAGS